MKKISIISSLLALLVLAGCGKEETPDLGVDSQWIQFGEANYSVTENSTQPIVVQVLYAADTNPNGVTVNYTVNSSNPDAYTISPSTGSVTIPAGEFIGEIVINPINNSDTDGNKEITISLDNTDIPVGLAGEGMMLNNTKVLITDDDCELDIRSFEGSYFANEFGYCDGCYKVSIVYDEVNDVLVLDNLYETGGKTYISLDNTDPSNPMIDFRSSEFGGALEG